MKLDAYIRSTLCTGELLVYLFLYFGMVTAHLLTLPHWDSLRNNIIMFKILHIESHTNSNHQLFLSKWDFQFLFHPSTNKFHNNMHSCTLVIDNMYPF